MKKNELIDEKKEELTEAEKAENSIEINNDESQRSNKNFLRKFWDEYKQLIVMLLATLVLFKGILFLGIIPSESMEPTLDIGAGILGQRVATSHIERGDVIVFNSPDKDNTKWIKRVIGLSGDKILIKGDGVYVNGKKLKEDYVTYTPDYEYAEYEVPKDSYFVMGDNRNNSLDSRFWGYPYLNKADIVAKVYVSFPLRMSCESGCKTL